MSAIADMKKREREINQQVFELLVAQFIKNWAPKDEYDNHQFHAQLHSLIRNTFTYAQQPLLDQMTALIGTLPPLHIVPK